MLFDDRKLVSVIVGKMKGRKPEYVEEMKESVYPEHAPKKEYKPGYEQASYEMIKAIKKDDPISFAHSMKNFIEMCMDEYNY